VAATSELALRCELPCNESNRYDAEPLRGIEQTATSALAGSVVLEGYLIEPGERVPDMGGVMDR
jgi:hypothetical protein